ncbi:UDP-N-acetylglucosamine 4,6-dehydratase (inverting) [Candidatus Pelagibacter bacterium]|jgi:UDP-N-acetylglucosamine 4,6-dehydratase|nr:UDP-N-acetylglucosamine 4,6-dehydratase (inverting) [Candidatus Pelagibacter bacterium]
MFNNKSIAITGGTGSFGKKFINHILKNYKPKKLIIYSRDELKQSELIHEYKNKYKSLRFFIGDVRDRERLTFALREIDIVVHAAALKQVETAEYNPMECLKTNVYGAENIISACLSNRVKKVIALSTDKAVNPINLYGVSKLASDKLFVSANLLSGNIGTKFSVVRYGNVVGSRGSVVPLFDQYIKNKSKFLPITDANMTRFWITIEDGVKFVIKSFQRMIGGEIFIPIIPTVKITDLAEAMAPNLKQKIIGIRPGEKIHESLCSLDESQLVRNLKDHYVILPNITHADPKKKYINNLKQVGLKVSSNFHYTSDSNNHFLNIREIQELNKKYLS